ncbi:SDR family oxidoreductase [Paenibacillus sp.]|uniref:SDR family oxidoreductase n=1 Tax=Paenibacillus sp. TaxID=58172 RepID=UPI002D554D49|nr:NmrA family NAD(P)-binding protein [Paenibacillus sp.]HZG84777.1 NmrA family NAD(P)-binding protein [Paenibacillus sp.]
MKEKVLVYGAGGEQGGAVARRLIKEGFAVKAIVRKEETAKELRMRGIEAGIGRYEDADSLREGTRGAKKVVFQLPQEHDEAKAVGYARNIIGAAKEEGVSLIVFNTSSIVPEQVDLAPIRIKRRVIGELAASGIPYIVLKPTAYMENVLGPWTAPGILQQGTFAYPIPEHMAVSWIALDDMAGFVAEALRRPQLSGAEFQLGGPEALTGPQVAKLLGARLGREIGYLPIPLDLFERQLSSAIGEEASREVTGLYRWQSGLDSSPLDVPNLFETLRQLPVRLTPFRTFLANAPWEQLLAEAARKEGGVR